MNTRSGLIEIKLRLFELPVASYITLRVILTPEAVPSSVISIFSIPVAALATPRITCSGVISTAPVLELVVTPNKIRSFVRRNALPLPFAVAAKSIF